MIDKTVEFFYDAFDQLIGRKVTEGGTTSSRYFVYDQGQIVLEFDGPMASDLTDRYLWGPDGDGSYDNLDLEQLIVYVIKTYYGDTNLDGEFNSSDLALVYQYAEFEDSESNNSQWQDGDWNGDGEFDSSDLLKAMAQPIYEAGLKYHAIAALRHSFRKVAGTDYRFDLRRQKTKNKI